MLYSKPLHQLLYMLDKISLPTVKLRIYKNSCTQALFILYDFHHVKLMTMQKTYNYNQVIEII